jgi:hypothetical protein
VGGGGDGDQRGGNGVGDKGGAGGDGDPEGEPAVLGVTGAQVNLSASMVRDRGANRVVV